jgi:hypothetical protein
MTSVILPDALMRRASLHLKSADNLLMCCQCVANNVLLMCVANVLLMCLRVSLHIKSADNLLLKPFSSPSVTSSSFLVSHHT